LDILKKRSVLVIAAHPDDEVLGCGGTIRRHADGGDAVTVLFLTDGVGARNPDDVDTKTRNRQEYAQKAAMILGASAPCFLTFSDNRLDSIPLLDVVQAIEAVIEALQPDIIYTHHGGDLNIDHRVCHEATLTACRPLPDKSVSAIYGFETLSSTEWGGGSFGEAFLPQRFVDIAQSLDQKLEALEAYREEMRPFPHPRSFVAVRALAQMRGSQAGLNAAEAFSVIREIVRPNDRF
jgi:N-acetylglucosamine malate deacetylase 1